MRTSVLCPVRGGQPPQGTTSPVTRSRAVGGGNTSQVRGGAASNGVGSSGGGATSSTSSGSGAVAGRASTSGGASGSSASASHDRPIGGRGSTASPLPTKGRSSTGGTFASLRHPRSSKVPQAASSNVGTDAASATPSTASTAYPSRKTSIDISIQTDDSWLPLSDLSHSQLRHCRHDSYDPPPYGGEFTPETLHLGSRTTVVGPQGAVVRGGPVRVRHAMSPWDSLDPSTWPSPRVALGDHAASNFGARGPSSAEPSPPGSVRSIRRSTVSEGRRHGVCSAVLEEGEITGSSDPLRVQRLEDQLASVTAERDKLRQFLTDLALRLGQTTSGTLCHQHIPITGQEFPHCSISSVSTGTPLGCTPGGASPVIATARLNLSELHAVLSSGCGADVCVGDDGDCAGGIPSPGGGGEAIVMLTADLDRTLGGEASGARRGSQAIGVCTPPVAVAMDGGQVSVSSSSRSSSMVSSRTSSPRGGCKKGFSKRALHGADCADETDEVAPMLPGSCSLSIPLSTWTCSTSEAAYSSTGPEQQHQQQQQPRVASDTTHPQMYPRASTAPRPLVQSPPPAAARVTLIGGKHGQASPDRPHPRHVLRHSATAPVLSGTGSAPTPGFPSAALVVAAATRGSRCGAVGPVQRPSIPRVFAPQHVVSPGGGSVNCPAITLQTPWPPAPVAPPPPTPRILPPRAENAPIVGERNMSPPRSADRWLTPGSPPPPLPRRTIPGSGSASVPPPGRPPSVIPGASGYISSGLQGTPSRTSLVERSCSPQPHGPSGAGRSVSVTRRHFRQLWILEREEHLLLDLPPGVTVAE